MQKGLATILIVLILTGAIALAGGGYYLGIKKSETFQVIFPSQYILDSSEGSCQTDNQCQWAGKGCGGGHGVCTDNPEKYKKTLSTCDVNPQFPANRGYQCGCVSSLNKCGWKK